MRWLRILSTYEFDIQHRAGTKHGNAAPLSRASHAPFLSKREATEVLADDQILALGEALEDDGQESEKDYNSLDESDDENDPRLSVPDEFPVPQEIQQKTLVDKQQANPLLSKIRRWGQEAAKTNFTRVQAVVS